MPLKHSISHYSPHKTARLCFSHDATYRPSGCQATALTMDLKSSETLWKTNSERIFRSRLSINEQRKHRTIPSL